MPPRFAYWTILIDDRPTAFRATKVEELLPTFKQLKAKNPSAVMMWSQFGKLWSSPEEAMAEGKTKDPRQTRRPHSLSPKPQALSHRPSAVGPKPSSDRPKLEWKPKGTFTPAERGHLKPAERPKLEWKPRGSFTPAPRTHPRPQAVSPKPQALGPRPSSDRATDAPPRPPRPKRQPPKPGSKNWRPGGDHQDPRQKYKDAKKAKWTRFKQAIRARSDKKGKPKP